jgi:glycosyltransferase involved in cell wall biosynthesis
VSYQLNKPIKERAICVVVMTKNNAQKMRYEYNLQSILNQDYTNYKLVIIDQSSTDGTDKLIEEYMH